MSEARGTEVCHQVGIASAEQRIGDHHDSQTFSGIAECLGAGDHQDVFVIVFGDSRLEGRHARCGDVAAEIHAEIGKILYDNRIVCLCNLGNDTELLVGEADP